MDWLSALVLSICASILAMAIWEKAKSKQVEFYLDEKSISLLQFALKVLPETERELYEEEWFMFLCDQPSAVKRVLQAMLLAKAATSIRAEVSVLVPLSNYPARQNFRIAASSLRGSFIDLRLVKVLASLASFVVSIGSRPYRFVLNAHLWVARLLRTFMDPLGHMLHFFTPASRTPDWALWLLQIVVIGAMLYNSSALFDLLQVLVISVDKIIGSN